ncbi:hypothetical protein BAU15_00720 [Enterococcus sp. JM4C]|uniref:FUSC family protein n=1 Tax=Candidatus Enterococcus huntleyi TaxID=1857217 RepID=UPI001379AED4|nr:FUSC family protein [Enterococcus sp. JM4C]KAF1299202.1 hypothetical protein BAU15_00720 [Enterococcus sp. JM4C]
MKPLMKELTTFHETKDNPFRLLGAGICMLTILLLGYALNDLSIGSFGSLGIFTFLYYQNIPIKQLATRLSLVGSCLLIGNFLGMLSTHLDWTAPILVGLVAFFGRLLFRLFKIAKPGVFFIVMVTGMGTSTKIPLENIPKMSLYFLIGLAISIIAACLVQLTEKTAPVPVPKISLQERLYTDPAAIVDALFYGGILFFAVYLSQALQLVNPYWLVISCAAILQGDNLRAMMHRNIQRIFGTSIGILIAAFLLNLPLTTLQSIIIITLLYLTVEVFVRRNYAVANFFTTPMTLMLSTLARQQYIFTLIQYRFLGIVLGSLLGVLSAWIMVTGLTFYNRAFQLHETVHDDIED